MERDYKYVVLNGNHSLHACRAGGWKRYRFFLAILLCVGISLGIYLVYYANNNGVNSGSMKKQKLLFISIDAFRYNLCEKALTKNLDYIVKHGVSVDHMLNVFPTVTLTNHQSMMTGLYPENHGILGNKMYDRETKDTFYMSNTQAKFWNDAVPIWIENELQGHKSGVCYFPGYDVLFGGKQATFVPPVGRYDSPLSSAKNITLMPEEERIKMAMEWLEKPEVSFVALYFGRLDELMHKLGADPIDKRKKKQLQNAITEMDEHIGKIMDYLKKPNLANLVNIVIVGDHGMSNTNRTGKVIDLTRYVNLKKLSYFHGDGHIYAKPNQTQSIFNMLKEAEKREGHLNVYLKKDIPDRYHLRNHPRTGDILYVLDEGWLLWTYGKLNRNILKAGYHGYSTDVKNMHPAFFAYGPAFREGYIQATVNMVDLYELMCHILKLKPKANDGNFENVKSMLKAL